MNYNMKLLVISDTHGYLSNARNVIERIGEKINGVIHLGDHDEDAKELQEEFSDIPFYYIRGNNDYGMNTPDTKMLNVCGKKIIITHGHKQQVYWSYDNIAYWAQEKGADAVFFGHTHRPANEYDGSIYIFNPGSISLPRGMNYPTFGIFDIDEKGNMKGTIMVYVDEDNFMRLDKLF